MRFDQTRHHHILQHIRHILVVCILLLPLGLVFLPSSIYRNMPLIFALCTVGGGSGDQSGTPWPRLGAYKGANGNWHCPGGGDATSCGSGNGPGGMNSRTNPVVPPPPATRGTINAFAFYTSSITKIKTCDILDASRTAVSPLDFLLPTQFWMVAGEETIGFDTQTDATGSKFIFPAPYTYTAAAIHANTLYSPYIYCHKNSTATSWTSSTSIELKADDTVTLYVGFITPPLPWVQVMGGGNTYANNLYSKMPLLNNPNLLFDKTAAPLLPGIVSVKNEGEISDQEFILGTQNISSKNWSTNNGMIAKNWYAFYTTRLAQATQLPYTDGGSKPTWTGESTYTVYTTNWVIMFIIVIFPPHIGTKCGF